MVLEIRNFTLAVMRHKVSKQSGETTKLFKGKRVLKNEEKEVKRE